MLPLTVLDDLSYKELVDNARKLIPKLFPAWTDENAHDPGMTMIELLAWLTELQQYYLDRIPSKSELKFMKLLGVSPQPAIRARADVTFEGLAGPVNLPRGICLTAGEQYFETRFPITLLPVQIERVMVISDQETVDASAANDVSGVGFLPFGSDSVPGTRMLLGLDAPLPADQTVYLHVYLDPSTAVSVLAGAEPPVPSVRLAWSYYGGEPGAWEPARLIEDFTGNLTHHGYVSLSVPSPMKAARIEAADDQDRYWLCCTLVEGRPELSPRIDRISMNTVPVIQEHTLSETLLFSGSETATRFEAQSWLALHGRLRVQFRINHQDWVELSEGEGSSPEPGRFVAHRDFTAGSLRFSVHPDDLASSDGSIRLIAYRPEFEVTRRLGRGRSLPGLTLEIQEKRLLRDTIALQVGLADPLKGRVIWQDWHRVTDFDTSGPDHRHFVLDESTGAVTFGNNEQGLMPPAAEFENIVIIDCKSGGGSDGNVRAGEIRVLANANTLPPGLTAANYFPAAGGRNQETMAMAKERLISGLYTSTRAVTAEDYEAIALETPGVRVARAAALPLYVKGMRDYPANRQAGQVTVVVMPYSERALPTAGPGFLETVHRHLDRVRLITTRVHVIPAEYVKISVFAGVVQAPGRRLSQEKVREVLNDFLSPYDPEQKRQGWPFGRTVYRSDIYGAISRIPGVEYIKELWLTAEGVEVEKEESGDICIPPYALPYLGDAEIEIFSPSDL